MTNGGEVGTRYKIGGRVAAFTGWAAAASCVCSVAMGDMVVVVVGTGIGVRRLVFYRRVTRIGRRRRQGSMWTEELFCSMVSSYSFILLFFFGSH